MRIQTPITKAWVLTFGLLMAPPCFAQSVAIELANNVPAEQHTKAELQRLLSEYDTSRYTFTHTVIIDEKSIPHSHPVLTLHTRHLGHDDELLSAYLHEQLHWYLDSKLSQTAAAEAELRMLYPKVPVGYPDGAQDEASTYLHLIDCYLEWQADEQLMGAKRALTVIEGQDHYRWVYKTILAEPDKIKAVIQHNGLEIA
jgi:hypothetical protein